MGSFVAVCSIAAQALNSSTNHLGFKAQCHTPEPVVKQQHQHLCTTIYYYYLVLPLPALQGGVSAGDRLPN